MDKLIRQIGLSLKKQNTLKNCYDYVNKYKSNDYKKYVKFSDINYKKIWCIEIKILKSL